MEEALDDKITKRLAELPADVRQAVESVDMGEKIRAIGARHGLHVDQLGALEDEIMLVMLGFADPGVFTERLEAGLHLSAEQAAQVTEEAVEQFFLPIRESMKHFMAAQAASHTLEAPHTAEEPVAAPKMPAAEQMLAEKTVVVPPKPETPNTAQVRAYTKDPYREPIE